MKTYRPIALCMIARAPSGNESTKTEGICSAATAKVWDDKLMERIVAYEEDCL